MGPSKDVMNNVDVLHIITPQPLPHLVHKACLEPLGAPRIPD